MYLPHFLLHKVTDSWWGLLNVEDVKIIDSSAG